MSSETTDFRLNLCEIIIVSDRRTLRWVSKDASGYVEVHAVSHLMHYKIAAIQNLSS
jgi:hypothetical protein